MSRFDEIARALADDGRVTRRTGFRAAAAAVVAIGPLAALRLPGTARGEAYCFDSCAGTARKLFTVQMKVCKPVELDEAGERPFGLACIIGAYIDRRSDLRKCAAPSCGDPSKYPKATPSPTPSPSASPSPSPAPSPGPTTPPSPTACANCVSVGGKCCIASDGSLCICANASKDCCVTYGCC